jgi:hypothetical protein
MQTARLKPSQDSRALGTAMERRNDLLLRDVVHGCQRDLEQRGFRLSRRGSSGERNWVQFSRPVHDSNGHPGMMVVLMAHGRHERALLVDAYFVDTTLDVQTPRRKLLHRYAEEAELRRVVREVVDAVCSWPS